MEGFSTNNMITNEDIVITYTPSVINYSYVIIKDNVYGEVIYVTNRQVSEIKLTEEGSYKIEVTENGIINTGNYVIDKTSPVLNIKEKTYKTEDTEINLYLQ